ncbi:MAG: ATP-dependent Clp protease ATP-binding subunit [Ruminococcaceae bacterium]|nr:ATP-dependent Clp protease ATP-binding subunit [Oscillospiraceae bacterium]
MMCSRCGKRPAVIFISRPDNDNNKPEGLCLTCAKELNIGPVKQLMEQMGITDDDLEAAQDQLAQLMSDNDGDFELGGAQPLPFMNFMQGEKNTEDESSQEESREEEPDEKKSKHKNKKSKRKYLSTYCTDLTKKALNNEIDRIIGRDKEISRVIQILCRRTKNNPCLVGEPGVGKTAIAEGIALKIAAGDVPAKLADKEIFLLDLTALVAGTQFRGQFESRIKGLIDEVKKEGNIILFIDEVHNLVGSGGDSEGTMNAANILKPALSRGLIQVIGATTFDEYRKYIEKDSALERRFQPVSVEEPSLDDTTEILMGIKEYYESFHRVKISDELIRKTVELSERYITDRFLPDKAIDLLDEACTCANLRNKAISSLQIAEQKLKELQAQKDDIENIEEGKDIDYEALLEVKSKIAELEKNLPEIQKLAADNQVLDDDLATVINLWTGVPVQKIQMGDLKNLKNMEKEIKAKIIGQDEAVDALCKAIRRSRVQISARRRPASFIFVGPTGVGKTELVKQLSYQLFSTPETLIRLDMSEFMEKHSVSRIIGSPPGYVGYDEAGQLTEKVRRKPYSVVLFDEIEKAHPDVMNILLQILDEGKVTDAHGRTVSFANTVIVMTSNAGSTHKDTTLGFAKDKATVSKERAIKALEQFLKPEFIGRVDEIIAFNPLSKENYIQIAALMLEELIDPLKDKGIILSWNPKVLEVLAEKSFGGPRGARDLANSVRKYVEDPIAAVIVEKCDEKISSISLEAKSDEIIVNVV